MCDFSNKESCHVVHDGQCADCYDSTEIAVDSFMRAQNDNPPVQFVK